jgi:hypothetical protein
MSDSPRELLIRLTNFNQYSLTGAVKTDAGPVTKLLLLRKQKFMRVIQEAQQSQ